MTLELAIMAHVICRRSSVFRLGIISAYRHNSPCDAGTMVVANIGVSMPIFWLGLLLAALFGVALKDTPFQLPTCSRLTAGMTIPPLATSLESAKSRRFPGEAW